LHVRSAWQDRTAGHGVSRCRFSEYYFVGKIKPYNRFARLPLPPSSRECPIALIVLLKNPPTRQASGFTSLLTPIARLQLAVSITTVRCAAFSMPPIAGFDTTQFHVAAQKEKLKSSHPFATEKSPAFFAEIFRSAQVKSGSRQPSHSRPHEPTSAIRARPYRAVHRPRFCRSIAFFSHAAIGCQKDIGVFPGLLPA
jgi:hypothetical protein